MRYADNAEVQQQCLNCGSPTLVQMDDHKLLKESHRLHFSDKIDGAIIQGGMGCMALWALAAYFLSVDGRLALVTGIAAALLATRFHNRVSDVTRHIRAAELSGRESVWDSSTYQCERCEWWSCFARWQCAPDEELLSMLRWKGYGEDHPDEPFYSGKGKKNILTPVKD